MNEIRGHYITATADCNVELECMIEYNSRHGISYEFLQLQY